MDRSWRTTLAALVAGALLAGPVCAGVFAGPLADPARAGETTLLRPAAGAAGDASAVGSAQARVDALLREVAALDSSVDAAVAAYADGGGRLAAATARRVRSAQAAQAAGRDTQAARGQRDARVRALWMAGGPAAAYASALADGDLGEVVDRLAGVRRVLAADSTAVTTSSAVATAAATAATTARDAAASEVQALRAVGDQATRLEQLLTQASLLLDQAQAQLLVAEAQARAAAQDRAARAARLAAEREAARLAAARSAAAGVLDQTITEVKSALGDIPAAYLALYHRAAATCPGLPWSVLAAVGRVESRHGADTSTSSAGARGPMQFLPSTWAMVAVDGNGDGRTDITDPADAIFTAARYLCDSGASRDLSAALWAYNRAQWYVRLVLSIAADYARQAGEPPPT